MGAVETALGAARAAGRPSLVGYVTGGIRADWTDLLAAMIDAGADAVEIGLPFSDPMLDGPVIQRASDAALARGASPARILAELRRGRAVAGAADRDELRQPRASAPGCPATAPGWPRPGSAARSSRTCPPPRRTATWPRPAQAGLDATLMVTPATPAAQRRVIAARTRGFLYVMSVMATTGTTAEQQDPSRWAVAARAR